MDRTLKVLERFSEAQKLALLESERTVAIAIFEWLNARERLHQALEASKHIGRHRIIYLAIIPLVLIACYKVFEIFFPSATLSSVSKMFAAAGYVYLAHVVLKAEAEIKREEFAAREAEKNHFAKIEAYVPSISANLYGNWKPESVLHINHVKQEPAFDSVRRALISEIVSAVESAELHFFPNAETSPSRQE